MASRGIALVATALATACTSTRMVRRDQITQLAGGGLSDGVALRSTTGWRSRLDPASKVRFVRADGEASHRFWAQELGVNRRGVFARDRVPAGEWIDRVRVSALDAAGRQQVIDWRPRGGELVELAGDRLELRAAGSTLVTWMHMVTTGMRANHSRARGSWWLHIRGTGWRGPLGGRELRRQLDQGIPLRAGWSWRDIDHLEVTDLSGGKTFVSLVGMSAAAVAFAPVMLGLRGLDFTRGGGGGGGGGGGKAADFAVRALGPGEVATRDDGSWHPRLSETDGAGAVHLFDGGARRRAIVRFFAVGDAAIDLTRPDALVDGVAVGVRVRELVELGGGARHIAAPRLDGDRLDHSGLAFFRFGLHLPLDAEQRVAIPLGFDAGAGPGVRFLRVHLGLRVRMSQSWFAGAYLFNPTRIRHVGGGVDQPLWTFPSGIELGAAF